MPWGVLQAGGPAPLSPTCIPLPLAQQYCPVSLARGVLRKGLRDAAVSVDGRPRQGPPCGALGVGGGLRQPTASKSQQNKEGNFLDMVSLESPLKAFSGRPELLRNHLAFTVASGVFRVALFVYQNPRCVLGRDCHSL